MGETHRCHSETAKSQQGTAKMDIQNSKAKENKGVH